MRRERLSARRIALLVTMVLAAAAAIANVPAYADHTGAGTATFEGAYAADNTINAVESDAADPSGRPVVWTDFAPGTSAYAIGRFVATNDPTATPIGGDNNGCGPYLLPPDHLGVDGFLNLTCMAHVEAIQPPAGGVTIYWVVQWFDATDTVLGLWGFDDIVVDTLVPATTDVLDTKITTSDVTAASVPWSWDVTDDADNSVALKIRSVPGDDSSVLGGCDYTPQIEAATGAINGACLTSLKTALDGTETSIEAYVEGTDAAGNTGSATEVVPLDFLGSATPSCDFVPDFVNAGNVTAVVTNVTGAVTDTIATLSISDGTNTVGTGNQAFDGDTDYTLDLSTLADGPLTATATTIDLDGNSSLAGTCEITKDIGIPSAPGLTSPAAGSLNRRPVDFAGTGDVGSKVRLYDGAGNALQMLEKIDANSYDPIDFAEVDASGHWIASVDYLESGPRDVKATQEDTAGNVSAFNGTVPFDVDVRLPEAGISSPAELEQIMPGAPEVISGTARDDYAGLHKIDVRIYNLLGFQVFEGEATCTPACGPSATAPKVANWTINVDNMPPGLYTVKIWSVDRANNRTGEPASVRYLDLD